MIIINRKSVMLAISILIYFLLTLTLLAGLSHDEETWFANIFFDKLYVFQLTSMFLTGIVLIERYMTAPVITRMDSRMKAMAILIKNQYVYAFIYLALWFTLIIIFSVMIQFVSAMTVFELLDWFVRYYLGLVLLINLVIIFSRSNIRFIADNYYIFAYMILTLEIIALIPELKINTRFQYGVLFSWIFQKGYASYVPLVAAIVISLVILCKISVRKDMLC